MSKNVKLWGVKDPNISSQLVLAQKLNFFKDEGLDAGYRLLQSGTTMPREILRASIKPLAWTQTVMTTLILREHQLDVKIIAPLADISNTQQVVIHDDSAIESPHDLIGQKVGMSEGAAIYVALQNMSKDYGLDLAKINFVNLLPKQQLEEFQQRNIAAMACWEPWTTRALESGGRLFFSGSQSNIPQHEGPVNWLIDQSMLMTTTEHIEYHQEQLGAVMRAMAKATKFLQDDLKEAARLLSGPLSVGYFEALHMLEQNHYIMNMDSMFRIGIYSIRELLYNSNIISTLPEEQDLYTPDFLRQLDPELVSLGSDSGIPIEIEQTEHVYLRQGASIQHDAASPLSFLLADDSSVIRKLFQDVITALHGKFLGEATTGREAIAHYKTLMPDLVIMDLSMPGMTGIDAIDGILQFNPEANIIVLSGSNFPETRREVFELGAKMFIAKPFDFDRVIRAIQSIISVKPGT